MFKGWPLLIPGNNGGLFALGKCMLFSAVWAQGKVLNHPQGVAPWPSPEPEPIYTSEGTLTGECAQVPWHPKALFPTLLRVPTPSIPPPPTGVQGPSSVPCAEGLPGARPRPRVLTPQQEQGGDQCHRRSRHRAQRRGPGCPGFTPSPRFFVPSPHSAGSPPRCARGSPAAESAPTRLRLWVTSRRRFLTPPRGAGPGEGLGADACLGAGPGRPPTRARRQAVSRAWRPPPKRQQSRAPSFRASCHHPG